jgi:hypothetical protein
MKAGALAKRQGFRLPKRFRHDASPSQASHIRVNSAEVIEPETHAHVRGIILRQTFASSHVKFSQTNISKYSLIIRYNCFGRKADGTN